MRNLIILLFASVFIFACSEKVEEATDAVTEAAEETMEKAGEVAEDAMEKVEEVAKNITEESSGGPQLEPLPDWDSLPPIEEVFEENAEKVEEVAASANTDDIVEKVKEVAEEVIKDSDSKEGMAEKAESLIKSE